jgi:hypothetical protein
MQRDYSFQITREQYNYLLPVLRTKLLARVDRKIDKWFFIGTEEDHLDMLNRCKYIK